jgi:hypothetical protein
MVLSKSKVKRNPHSVTFLPLLVKYVTASWIQFVRIRTFSIQSGVGANLAAVVDPSFFLVYTEQLIKWWCEVGPCRVFLLITGLIAWAISKVCNILSYHYLLQYEISLKTKTFSVFKSGQRIDIQAICRHAFWNFDTSPQLGCFYTKSLFFGWKPKSRMKNKWSTSQNRSFRIWRHVQIWQKELRLQQLQKHNCFF